MDYLGRSTYFRQIPVQHPQEHRFVFLPMTESGVANTSATAGPSNTHLSSANGSVHTIISTQIFQHQELLLCCRWVVEDIRAQTFPPENVSLFKWIFPLLLLHHHLHRHPSTTPKEERKNTSMLCCQIRMGGEEERSYEVDCFEN